MENIFIIIFIFFYFFILILYSGSNWTQDKKPIKLKTYRYQAEKPKGVIIYFHTIGYHIGMSANLAKGLALNGFTFVGYDQRGHGKSEG